MPLELISSFNLFHHKKPTILKFSLNRSSMVVLQVDVCSYISSRSLHSDDLEVLGFCVGWFLERVVVVISLYLDLDFWGVIDGMYLFIWVCGS